MNPALWIASSLPVFMACAVCHAQKVETPVIDPPGGALAAPVTITFRCATPGAVIHVTTDGADPTERDLEIEPGASILLDTPSLVKARAVLRDGRASEVAGAQFALQPVPGDGASFLEQEVPSIIATGRSYRATVSFRNIGTTQWAAGTHRLDIAKTNAKWGWVPKGIEPAAPVAPWKVADFEFAISAPSEPGTYNFEWRMGTAADAPFGEASPVKRILVIEANADADGDGVLNWVELELGMKHDSADSDRNGIADSAEDRDDDGTPDATEYMVHVRTLNPEDKRVAKPEIAEADAPKKLLEVLKSGPRSYKELRALGFAYTDEQFDAFLKKHASLFLSTRSARAGEAGKPVSLGGASVMLNLSPAVASITEPYVRELLVKTLKHSARSAKYLRTIGYNYPDSDFEALIKANPEVFRATRIVRRDENGRRIIPGWPGIALIEKGTPKK